MRKIYLLLLLFILLFESCFASGSKSKICFVQKKEPKEKAFTFLMPKGWICNGGIFRLCDENIAGAMNMVDGKIDFSVSKDKNGTVMMRLLPNIMCIDTAYAFGYPEGAVFNNALVRQRRSPENFLLEVAVPYAHPNAQNIKVIGSKKLPKIAQSYYKVCSPDIRSVVSYYSAFIIIEYRENNKKYTEKLVTTIEDYSNSGTGLWKNRETMLFRTPVKEMSKWEKVFSVILNSITMNPKWVVKEINSQTTNSGIIIETQAEIQAIDKAICEHRAKTNAEINYNMFLTLTEQKVYVNPYTGKKEVDSSNWKHRWVNSNGDIVFADEKDYNPNYDKLLKQSGFKRSPQFKKK